MFSTCICILRCTSSSILGPVLFILYANDMSQAVRHDLFLYADDTCLVCQDKSVKWRFFCDICDWFVDNKLSNTFVPISNVLWSIYQIKQNRKTELIRFWPNDGVSFLNKKTLCCFLLYDMLHKNVWKFKVNS